MSLALQDVSNTAVSLSHGQSIYESKSEGCSRIASTSCSDISTKSTTDAVDYDETIYDDASVMSSDIAEEDDIPRGGDEIRARARSRRRTRPSNLPSIFFGTPCQAEHEKRAKYTTRMRDRRLLRRDSLELTRRKSIGERRHSGTEVPAGEDSEDQGISSSKNDISVKAASTLPSAEDDGWESEDSTVGEVAMSAEGDAHQFIGDATVNGPMSVTASDEGTNDSPPSSQDSLPSTPTKQIIQTTISRPSLCLSDAESSPGVALGLSSAPSSSSRRQSPFMRATPIRYQDENSPQLFKTCDLSPINVDTVMYDGEKMRAPQSKEGQNVLKESPDKANRSVSPSKGAHERPTLSPVKVVVRQTLSAWAHAKLKTPQSPEKKEWERLAAGREQVVASPTRKKERRASASSSSERIASVRHTLQTGPREGKSIPLTEKDPKPAAREFDAGEANGAQRSAAHTTIAQHPFVRPPSRIARPVPVSRIPRPRAKPAPAAIAPFSSSARRIQVVAPATPSYARIRNTTASTSTLSAHPVEKLKVSGAIQSPAYLARLDTPNLVSKTATPSMPTAQSPFVRVLGGGVRGPSTLSQSSSPNKAMRAETHHARPWPKSSPVVKKPIVPAAKILSEPIVRDARLFAAASQNGTQMTPSPAFSVPKKPTTASVTIPPASPQSSDTSTFSAGVGGARRVIPGQELAKPNARIASGAAAIECGARIPPLKAELRVDKGEVERRGARVKDITMGRMARAPAAEEAADASDAHTSSSLSSPPSLEVEAATEPDVVTKGLVAPSSFAAVEEKVGQQQREEHQPLAQSQSQVQQGVQQFVHPIRKARAAAVVAAAALPASQKTRTRTANHSPADLLPLSRTELSRLTSLHTRRNEIFVSQIDTVVVRKVGENRPASPSSKIRKTDTASGRKMSLASRGGSGKKTRDDRGKRRASDDESEIKEQESNLPQHALGPGETTRYASPPRRSSTKRKSVRWQKSLLLRPLDSQDEEDKQPSLNRFAAASDNGSKRKAVRPAKSCLSNKSFYPLDQFGNVCDTKEARFSPSLSSRKRITVYKIIYDDDEQ